MHYTTDKINFPREPDDDPIWPAQYRIEVKKTHQGWEQRHIWYWLDGSSRAEDWIPSIDFSSPGRLDNYTEISDAA